jgi:hypothetical protein
VSQKPTYAELMAEADKPDGKYVRETVEIEVFREAGGSNVYFVPDDEDCVLDKHVILTDQNGVVFCTRERSAAEKLSVFLRKGATGLLGMFGKIGLPVGVVEGLIMAVAGRSQKAARVLDALKMARTPGRLSQGVLELLWSVGPRKWRKSIGTMRDTVNKLPPEMVEKALLEAAKDKAIDKASDLIVDVVGKVVDKVNR